MNGYVKGVSCVGTGCVVLPNTGGHIALTVIALTSIAVGGAILVSTALRVIAAKKANRA